MKRISLLTWLALVGLFSACSRTAEKSPAAPKETAAIDTAASPPTPVDVSMEKQIVFEFAIYLPNADTEALEPLEKLLARKFTNFKRVESVSSESTGMALAAKLISDAQQSYAPPPREFLEEYGHGLSPEQIAGLQEATKVLTLDFTYPKEHVWDEMRSALELVGAVAQATGGLIWDEHTRELFTPQAWEEIRLADWADGIPDMAQQTVTHVYQKDQYLRAITLGMAKFGLPDIVVHEFSKSVQHDMEQIIHLFGQSLIEGARVEPSDEFELNIKTIKNVKVRDAELTSLGKNATGVARLSLSEGTWEEGDPQNRLVEITFDKYAAPDVHARQHKMILAMFGSEDAAVKIEHDDELRAASQRAIEKLPALRTTFNAGLQPAESIQVKAPFDAPEAEPEWMWVEVTSWKGNDIEGHLRNEPRHIATLHAGQLVHVSQETVFDYLHKLPDGTVDGNETSQIIEKIKKRTSGH